MFYLIWIPVVVVLYVLYAIASKKANESPDWTWVFLMYGLQSFGMWPIVSRYSKNLLFDGFLYDLLIFLTFYLSLLTMGAAKNFTALQWFASGLILAGLLLFKIS
jgi:hypothetical protein